MDLFQFHKFIKAITYYNIYYKKVLVTKFTARELFERPKPSSSSYLRIIAETCRLFNNKIIII